MKTGGRYSRAPITEAVIDLQVELPEGTAVSDLARCHAGQEEAYPYRQERRLAGDQTNPAGFVFTSADHRQVFQALLGGFSMSRLPPYESWQQLRDEARRLWNLYRRVAKPARVTRVAVRYINRFDLPLPVKDLKDYFRTAPEVSPDLPQALAGFFMQLTIPHLDIKSVLLLSETIVGSTEPGSVGVILDFDLYRIEDIPEEEDHLWQLFDDLRVRRNAIFEACITDQARELIR